MALLTPLQILCTRSFSSKEEFIVTFEEKLIAQKKQLELFNKRHIELSNQRLEILKKISSSKNSKNL